MPANTNPVFRVPTAWAVELDNADGTGALTLVAGGTQGSVIEALGATSSDTSAVQLDLYLHDGSTAFLLESISVPAGSGTDGGSTPAVDLLAALGWLSNGELFVPANWTFKVAAHAAITAAKVVHVTALGGDY